ncbi:hypothetical protein AS850_03640 [Frondihabitans sp. 762G35]|nr:hypothetical protein AS850_03640 [Frondihabitans sp. 762G35]
MAVVDLIGLQELLRQVRRVLESNRDTVELRYWEIGRGKGL